MIGDYGMDNKRAYKCTLKIFIVIYVITSIIGFYINYVNNDSTALFMGVVALITPWIIPGIFKLFKLIATDEIYIINLVFIYFASLIGSCFNGYSLPFFDKALHFSSGIFASLLAVILFCKIKKEKRINKIKDYYLFILFVNNTNLAIAMLWELYEYMMLILFNNDCINHYKTGVHDSMSDMICALIAGIIVLGLIHRYHKFGKNSFLLKLCENFYDQNY